MRASIEDVDEVVSGKGQHPPIGAIGQREDRRECRVGPPARPPGDRVEEDHAALIVRRRERPAVRRESEGDQLTPGATNDADGGRVAQQGGEQVAAGDTRIVQGDTLAREQQRAVRALFDQRLGTEAFRLGGTRFAACGAALMQGDDAS